MRNRFKGLDLIDRVPDELWMEVHEIVQEAESKAIPKKNKCKKAKWLSGEALQIAVKRREVKSKGEKERYKHLNAEFQRITRRDKKAFLSDKCKDIEENNRMGLQARISEWVAVSFSNAYMHALTHSHQLSFSCLIFFKRSLVFPILLFSSISLH